MVACKTSLAIRIDALAEDVDTEFIIDKRAKLELQLQRMESGQVELIMYHWCCVCVSIYSAILRVRMCVSDLYNRSQFLTIFRVTESLAPQRGMQHWINTTIRGIVQ